jgi:hypothetical protein
MQRVGSRREELEKRLKEITGGEEIQILPENGEQEP